MSKGISKTFREAEIGGAISRLVYDLTSPPLPPGEERTRAVAKFRAAREGTLAIVQNLSQEQADFSPRAGVWSIGQNVEHLLLTEQLYRIQMQNMIELARQGGRHNIALTFEEIDNSIALIPRDVIPKLTLPLNMLNMIVPRVVRVALIRTPFVPALNPTASSPKRGQPIAALRARAVASLNTTEEIFRGELPAGLMDVTLSHPIFGVNNIAHILGILAAHEDRHHWQIKSVVANPLFPPDALKSLFQLAEEKSLADNSTGTKGR
jgi:hypothetical protein